MPAVSLFLSAPTVMARDATLAASATYRPLAVQREYFNQHMSALLQARPGVDEDTLIDLTSRRVAPPEVGAQTVLQIRPVGIYLWLTHG